MTCWLTQYAAAAIGPIIDFLDRTNRLVVQLLRAGKVEVEPQRVRRRFDLGILEKVKRVHGFALERGAAGDRLATAAAVPGFIGFAVGRTTFWDALSDWRSGRTSREAAVTRIADRFREWVDIFERSSASRPEPVAAGHSTIPTS